ncbi:RCC1 domain-containing protein [Chondromyces apiculatus]|uniref:BNR repeat domain protein n=1 Tax=Chondromyces apiculatus DSM 436 TaxID=1192034 RepID=A0A017SXY0_9BACT|nr:RCC1 domain-containing protein [Chondromyces apiculatus]EYF01849.1 Hypothetical protein CAP_7730 [Chondromyces apiculatus DSM 436]
MRRRQRLFFAGMVGLVAAVEGCSQVMVVEEAPPPGASAFCDCYTGPAGTEDVGICRSGQQTCNADGSGYGPCLGEVLPGSETCDPGAWTRTATASSTRRGRAARAVTVSSPQARPAKTATPGEMGSSLPAVDLGAGESATSVTTGVSHTCIRLAGGNLKCWGDNEAGQLGLGDTASRGSSPDALGDNLPPVKLYSGGW